MARTRLTGDQVTDGTISRSDLDATTVGEAVVRRIIAGSNITLGSTGPDSGTGDVTINATGGGGSVTIGEVSLNFGSTPVEGLKFVFAYTGATVGQRILMMPNSLTNGDELEMDGLVCAAHVSDINEITAYITPNPGPISGLRYFNILIG